MAEITWKIHFVLEENVFKNGMCDAHTHGLDKYGHKELQFVLLYPIDDIGFILNTVGGWIADGRVLKDGDMIEGLTTDGAKLLVYETKDKFGDSVLRLIMPDGEFRYPEESTEYPYSEQYNSPYLNKN